MNRQAFFERWDALCATISSILAAAKSVVRGLSLFGSARPKTPLRVLCIMAFDTVHRLRKAGPLPTPKIRALAALLDFEACANAVFDNKEYSRQERRAALQLLEQAGLRPSVAEYLRRLGHLERTRPLPGREHWQFQDTVLYREAVVRLSLGMAVSTANGNPCLEEGIRATHQDAEVNLLFRLAMQCQIIDDVLDYSEDKSAGLPSFLTASKSLPHALELTRLAALSYAGDRDVPRTGDVFPLRLALFLSSAVAKLAIILGRCWLGHTPRTSV